MSTLPSLHIRPDKGWLNDPNGLSLIDGRYHVFFQFYPHRPVHQDIHWGHVSSTDLLHWRQEPVALLPRAGESDEGGCWSGCLTIDDDGVPTVVYTGVRRSSGEAAVVLARSHDGLQTFTHNVETAVGMPADEDISDVRDPFLFQYNGRRLAVQGAGRNPGGPARILLYDATDLDHWTLLGDLLTDADPVAAAVAPADIWECPNLIQIGQRWVLLVSLWKSVDGVHDLQGVRYLVGDLNDDRGHPVFLPSHGGIVDEGPAFYAPQVLALPDRNLLWGWAWELGRTAEQVEEAGWAGVLTFPREVGLSEDERLVSRPAAELASLRGEPCALDDALCAKAFELEGRDLRLLLDGAEVAQLTGTGRIMVDGSLIEMFPEDGVPVTTRAYPSDHSKWTVAGAVARAWPLTLG